MQIKRGGGKTEGEPFVFFFLKQVHNYINSFLTCETNMALTKYLCGLASGQWHTANYPCFIQVTVHLNKSFKVICCDVHCNGSSYGPMKPFTFLQGW